MHPTAVRAVLARTPALSAEHLRNLVTNAESRFAHCLDPGNLARTPLPPRARSYLKQFDQQALERDLEWIGSSGARLLAVTDRDYPGLLGALHEAPPVLYVLGNPRVLCQPQIAMVGARSASDHGRSTARRFAMCLARSGLTVTSGLAFGIDAASHEGALEAGGTTIAVCGTGLDIVYPTQHNALATKIRASGALVSQFPPRTPPRPANFPRRNSVVSGLAQATLVVEAARQSGSLITARLAGKQGRAVFAIPGPLRSALSAGCHDLIRAGARLVENPAELLFDLRIPHENEKVAADPNHLEAPAALDKGYEMLLDAVGFEPATVDVLAIRTGFAVDSVASMLLVLELQGHIASYPGGQFGRIP